MWAGSSPGWTDLAHLELGRACAPGMTCLHLRRAWEAASWPFVAKGGTGSGQYIMLLPSWGAFKCPWGSTPTKPPAAGTVPQGGCPIGLAWGGECRRASRVGLALWPGSEPPRSGYHPSPSRFHQFSGHFLISQEGGLFAPSTCPSLAVLTCVTAGLATGLAVGREPALAPARAGSIRASQLRTFAGRGLWYQVPGLP